MLRRRVKHKLLGVLAVVLVVFVVALTFAMASDDPAYSCPWYANFWKAVGWCK